MCVYNGIGFNCQSERIKMVSLVKKILQSEYPNRQSCIKKMDSNNATLYYTVLCAIIVNFFSLLTVLFTQCSFLF